MTRGTGNSEDGATRKDESAYRRYDFRWEVLDVIIGGKSLIDAQFGLTGFPMKSKEDADRFTRSYGVDLEDPIERAETFGNFHEAINFVRKFFLKPENPDGLALEIPRKILEITDPRDLLLMASMNFPGQMKDTQGVLLKNWACSILKVIHTIAHLDKDLRTAYLGDVQKQILDRFYKLVHRDSREQLYLGETPEDPSRVDLVAFETKSKKSRESTLLKLLHKPSNTAEDIYDQVGVRFITHTRSDSLRVVKCLKDAMIVMPPNVHGARSRNTLIDVETVKQKCEELLPALQKGNITEEQLRLELDSVPAPGAGPSDNPHSSAHYRSIQFTARQLIKLRNPLYDNLKELKALAKLQALPAEMQAAIDRIDLQYIRREVRFFYPYEVQVMDQASHEENEKGLSAHAEYKKSQLQTAMRRVMGSLMNAAKG